MGSDRLYYSLTLISLLYVVFKFRNYLSIFIILLFYDGLFAYYGSTVWNIYKFVLPFFGIFIAIRINAISKKRLIEQEKLIWIFSLFTIFFFFSAYLNNDYLTLILNQYSKYCLFFISFFIVKRFVIYRNELNRQVILIIYLLIIQGILAVIKFFIFGVLESLIGSVAYIGGAAGTVLPILGFVFIWMIRGGKLSIKDWLIILLLLFIGFGSMKRAIWFIMPVVVFLFIHYIPRKRLTKKNLIYIPVIFLIFYIGIRLNPTLNPQSDYWGKFDPGFAYKYAKDYSVGNAENNTEGSGRVGATLNLFKSLFNNTWDRKTLFGFGLKEIYVTTSAEFDAEKYGINTKGSATGILQTYISGGILSIITTLLLAGTVIFYVKNKRIQTTLLLIFLWEYLFYTGIILRTPALSFLLVFSIVYANYQSEKMLMR
jgi:hypothetical protein